MLSWEEHLINALVERYEASSPAAYYAACDRLGALRRARGHVCYYLLWNPSPWDGHTPLEDLEF